MSFRFAEVQERFAVAQANQRLAHAYLFTGGQRESLDRLALALADFFLKGAAEQHPDFHVVRPESKSRRIRIEQMRLLEKALTLKAYYGGMKVALIAEAERMCLGSADAANAFLKTLEEPPAGTLILLTSAEPGLLLPTILSRCVNVRLLPEIIEPNTEFNSFINAWFASPGQGPLRAYARANLLTRTWNEARERLGKSLAAEEAQEEEIGKATLEAEVLLFRKQSICALQQAYWETERAPLACGEGNAQAAMQAVRLLEELNQALLQNVEAGLAVERTCLAISRC
jgi:DNA polymerase III subunit delta'